MDRRQLCCMVLVGLSGCQLGRGEGNAGRIRGIGLVLVADAVPGAEMDGVEFFADRAERSFYSSAVLAKRNREIMAFPYGTVPNQVRVVWRKFYQGAQVRWGDARYFNDDGTPKRNVVHDGRGFDPQKEIARRKSIAKTTGVAHYGPWGSNYGGPIAGDYTISIASRIPEQVLREINARGGSLRLKFRLKPDGVLFGWDIERSGGGTSKFEMAGGDFLETRY